MHRSRRDSDARSPAPIWFYVGTYYMERAVECRVSELASQGGGGREQNGN